LNGIEVPIEFKYHASGVKYDDISLEVGLGWSLIAGGTIDYTIRGSLDNQNGNSYGFIKMESSNIAGDSHGNPLYLTKDAADNKASLVTTYTYKPLVGMLTIIRIKRLAWRYTSPTPFPILLFFL